MRVCCFAAAIFCLTNAFGGEPLPAAQQVRDWREAHQLDEVQEFAELLSIPNLATDGADIPRNAEAIRRLCEKRGLTTQVINVANAPPLVVADLPAAGARRTIAFYAHYDGQPVDRAQWKSDPWQPVMRDATGGDVDWRHASKLDPEWRLYARSAGDDKVAIVAMLAALDALHAARISPRVNLRFVFEGEEEAGSPHLGDYFTQHQDALRADAWVLCDGPVHQSRRMQLAFGARGTVGVELTVFGPIKALHSGHYGNWVPNPAVRLAHLIDSMRDEEGRILIKGFYDDVRAPTVAEREALTKIPNVDAELRREFQIGATEGGGKSLYELIMQPALNVRGLQSGHVAEQASNSIPTEARASIEFRLVPNESPERVQQLVERHIEGQGYTIVRDVPDTATRSAHAKTARVNWSAGVAAARTPLDDPFSRELIGIMTSAGHEPVLLPTLGGSLPIPIIKQGAELPVIVFPIANHDNNQHAANENLRLQNLWDDIDVLAAFFAALK